MDSTTLRKPEDPRAAGEARHSYQSGDADDSGDSLRPGEAAPAPDLSLEELEAQITELTGQLNAANYRWLALIAEFDRRLGWAGPGLYSCAHWLNFKCGLALGAAREKVRVARALESLPRFSAAMAAGQLSYSKARALTRVADADTEKYLLHLALHGTAQHVENLVRLYRRSQEAQELSREAQQQARREVSYWFDTDGSLVLKARLPAVAGAVLIKALESAMQDIPESETNVKVQPPEEVPLGWQARRADALAHVAENFLQRGAQGAQGKRHGSTADRYQVVVHVDAQTLRDSSAGRCEIEHGPAIPAETVRRLSCDASLVTLIENAQGEPLDVGRKTRSIPPAIRRALHARDLGCRFPGCTHQRYLDAHHIRHWAQGGDTKLANLVTLCRFHHRLVHEGGIRVAMTPDGAPRFMRPDGTEFDRVISLDTESYDWREIPVRHAAQGIHIDPKTAVTRWCGERMDYDLAVAGLQQDVMRAQRVSHDLFHDASIIVSPDISHNGSPDVSGNRSHAGLHHASHESEDVPAGTSRAADWDLRPP